MKLLFFISFAKFGAVSHKTWYHCIIKIRVFKLNKIFVNTVDFVSRIRKTLVFNSQTRDWQTLGSWNVMPSYYESRAVSHKIFIPMYHKKNRVFKSKEKFGKIMNLVSRIHGMFREFTGCFANSQNNCMFFHKRCSVLGQNIQKDAYKAYENSRVNKRYKIHIKLYIHSKCKLHTQGYHQMPTYTNTQHTWSWRWRNPWERKHRDEGEETQRQVKNRKQVKMKKSRDFKQIKEEEKRGIRGKKRNEARLGVPWERIRREAREKT